MSARRQLPAAVGPETDETGPVCAYSRRLGDPTCQEPAMRHIVTDSPVYGVVGLASCDGHAEIARRAGALVDEHPFADACQVGGCWP